MMGKTRLEQIEDIYQMVIDQPPESRDAALSKSCGGDGELRREVESLLRYADPDSNFIDSPPALLAAEVFADEDEKRDLLGGRIGHYKIERLLGKGGMGEVYLAQDTRLNRNVALKIFPQAIAGDAERLMRFEREAQAASALNHPNILTVHEFGEADGVHFIATEFVDGPTLRHKLRAARLDLAETLEISVQAASALAAAHEAGITHRDVKPENIMIRRDGYVKVLDFGLAKLVQPQSTSTDSGSEAPTVALHRTEPGLVMGTAAYMSPEQARGRPVDARADIWSLGVVIYEMVTGYRPFAGETHADLIASVLRSEPEHLDDLPPEIEAIVLKALSKDLEARYQTAKEFRIDLDDVRRSIEFGGGPSRSSGRLSGEPVSLSISGKGAITDGNAARPTSGGMTDRRQSFLSSSGIEVIFQQANRHKIGALAVAVVVIGLISSGIYSAFFGVPVSDKIDSIAVLPFENASGDPEFAYISEGLSESLIDRLSQLPQLKVISRKSSFRFRGPNVDVRDVAAKLGVRAVVTGSVTKLGDDIAIRIDVVDAVEDRQLTGGQYRRRANDMAGLQSEIARATAEPLKLKLTEAQSSRLAERNTENSDSFRYYLNGLVALNGSDSGRDKALAFFEKAIELDSDFAPAHAEIAWIYWARANGSGDPGELMPKAKAAAEKALALDADLAKAHVVRAMVYEYEFDWREAENEYRRAIELSPNLDFARNNYAFFLSVTDRQDEALAQLEEQRVRDPLNQRLWLLQKGIVLVQARRFDDALQAYREAQAVDPSNAIPDFALGYAYAGKGLVNEAVEYYKKAVAELGGEGKYSQPLVYLAAAYAGMPGKRSEARAILARIEAMEDYKSPALLAAVYSALNENDRAIELLEQAYIKRDLLLRYIGTGYEYDGLRDDPRFVDLMRRSGLGK